jgi:predicted small secreted protein
VTVGGRDVGTFVVSGCVWTGAGVGGDTQPAAKIAAIKNIIVIISVLVPFI